LGRPALPHMAGVAAPWMRRTNSDRRKVREHLLKLGHMRGDFVGADGLKALPKGQNHGIGVRSGDGLDGDPLKDLDDCSICAAHRDRSPISDEPCVAQGRKMIVNQVEQRLLASRFRPVTRNGN